MSKIYFCGTSVQKGEDVKAIYSMGANFTAKLDNIQNPKSITGENRKHFTIENRKAALKIEFALYPTAIYGNERCMDVSKLENNTKIEYGIKLEGTSIVRTHGIKEALYCVGGIRVLFPLFRILGQQRHTIIPSTSPNLHDSSNLSILDHFSNPNTHPSSNFAIQVFSLLHTMLFGLFLFSSTIPFPSLLPILPFPPPASSPSIPFHSLPSFLSLHSIPLPPHASFPFFSSPFPSAAFYLRSCFSFAFPHAFHLLFIFPPPFPSSPPSLPSRARKGK